jgi:hypothetical protein
MLKTVIIHMLVGVVLQDGMVMGLSFSVWPIKISVRPVGITAFPDDQDGMPSCLAIS